jgi:sugar/nucleoside kinase (ribokinase family)
MPEMSHAASRPPVDVAGLGATSVDYVYILPASPEPGGAHAKMRISSRIILCGGQTATALATCTALGLRARFVGALGSDENGRLIRDELIRRGVDVNDAVVHDAANQYALILIDERTGERIVLWHRDEGMRLHEAEIRPELLHGVRVLHVDDVDEESAILAARLARAGGAEVTSDIDRVTERTLELVESVTIPIFAEHVPAAVTGESDPERALRKLRKRHTGILCVTLGAHGAVALDRDRFIHIPAFPVHAVDTTGAGDVFRGAFIYAMLQKKPVDEILTFANAAAAASCTKLGALNGVPGLKEVQKIYDGIALGSAEL